MLYHIRAYRLRLKPFLFHFKGEKLVNKISREEFLDAYMNQHSNTRGETFQSNSDRLFNWLHNHGYIEVDS